MMIGSADAPNTIVEYASMTCPHCALFQKEVLPQIKTKYIDTGKAKYILREFPLDGLALAAFMVARCSGNDRYFPMVDALFETQPTWAVTGNEGKDKLLLIARQSGMSKEEFDKCLADKAMFDKIVEIRRRGNEEFGVDSTPSFFVNGKRLGTQHELKDFDAILEPGSAETPAAPAPAPAGQ
jgi:protein-disulfide isomerase